MDVSPQMRVVRLQEKALVDEEEIRALKKQKLEIQIKKEEDEAELRGLIKRYLKRQLDEDLTYLLTS